MRIALVILHAQTGRGGAERYTIDIANALIARGHQVSLLASTFDVEGDASPALKLVPLEARGRTRVARYISFLDSLDAHLKQAGGGYDVVHAMLPVRRCDFYHPHAGLAVESVAQGHLKYDSGIARSFAWLSTQMNPRRRRFAKIERELLTGPNPPRVFCLSQQLKTVAQRHYSLPDDHLLPLFNGIDLVKFDPDARGGAGKTLRREFAIAPERVVALIIAQDFHRKGLRQAILAWARVTDPRVLLVVVGKEEPGAFALLARYMAKEGREVLFAGATSDPYAFYKAADFFVLPTRHDPCSLVVLESLAMGVPVITTCQNGACEIMQDGIHGFVLDNPQNIDLLAGRMTELMDDAKRQTMRQNCLALRPQLSQEHHVDALVAAYETVLHSRRR